jgi:hypothetical protein
MIVEGKRDLVCRSRKALTGSTPEHDPTSCPNMELRGGHMVHIVTVPGIFTSCLRISKIEQLSFYKLPCHQSLKDMDRWDKVNTMDEFKYSSFESGRPSRRRQRPVLEKAVLER